MAVDVELNNPLAKGLVCVGGGKIRGYRWTCDKYICVWSCILGEGPRQELADGACPFTIFPEDIIEYRRLDMNR
jgi:hypothetical protein